MDSCHRIQLLSILESAYNASVQNGIYKRMGNYGFARAAEVMSTESATSFEWSLKHIGTFFRVGIASTLRREGTNIFNYDENAILYHCDYSSHGRPEIKMGSNTIHSNLTTHKKGDVINFSFQPDAKKLVIEAV